MNQNEYKYLILFCLILILIFASCKEINAPKSQKSDEYVTRIIFVSDRTGNRDIFSMNPDGTDLINLTNNDVDDFSPSVSYDGKKIVFVSKSIESNEICIMNHDGSNLTYLTNNSRWERIPVFSPDDINILYVESDKAFLFNLLSFEINCLNGLIITSPFHYISFFPDGINILYQPANGLSVYNLNSYDDYLISDEYFFPYEPNLSMDGNKIAFVHHRLNVPGSSIYDIFNYEFDSDSITNVTQDSCREYQPTISPNGNHIAYKTRLRFDQDYKLFSIETNGNNKTELTEILKDSEPPQWSPDGSYIIFIGGEYWDQEIFRIDSTGMNKINLTNNLGKDTHPIFLKYKL